MDMNRKLELLDQSLKSIARHDDEDAAVRHAALDRVEAMVKAERAAMDKRVNDRIAETIAG